MIYLAGDLKKIQYLLDTRTGFSPLGNSRTLSPNSTWGCGTLKNKGSSTISLESTCLGLLMTFIEDGVVAKNKPIDII